LCGVFGASEFFGGAGMCVKKRWQFLCGYPTRYAVRIAFDGLTHFVFEVSMAEQ
jgi:hypothetical protein